MKLLKLAVLFTFVCQPVCQIVYINGQAYEQCYQQCWGN